jgi:hypothetical protein
LPPPIVVPCGSIDRNGQSCTVFSFYTAGNRTGLLANILQQITNISFPNLFFIFFPLLLFFSSPVDPDPRLSRQPAT